MLHFFDKCIKISEIVTLRLVVEIVMALFAALVCKLAEKVVQTGGEDLFGGLFLGKKI